MDTSTSNTQQFSHHNNDTIPITHHEDSHLSELSLHEFDKKKPNPLLKDQHFWTKST